MFAQEIIMKLQGMIKLGSFWYILDKETINLWRIDRIKKLRFG